MQIAISFTIKLIITGLIRCSNMSKALSGEWQRTRLKEVLGQIEHKQERLLNKNNRYGYELNINHPYIQEQWQKFKQLWSAGKIETDKPLYDDTARRFEFEKIIKNSSWFKKRLDRERSNYDGYM